MKTVINGHELDIAVSDPMTEFDIEALEQVEAFMNDEAFTSGDYKELEPIRHILFPIHIGEEEIDITFYTTKLKQVS